MEFNYDILLKVVGGLAGIYLLLSLFNVSGLTRIRTLSTLLIGIILVGWLGWPLVRPADPLGAITLIDGQVGLGTIVSLCGLAFAAGLVAYLASWPKGHLTAPLAAPAGMAVWVFASGDMRALLLYNSTLAQRQQAYTALGWEGLFWLLPVAAGLIGMFAGQLLFSPSHNLPATPAKPKSDQEPSHFMLLLTHIFGVFIAAFLIEFFKKFNSKMQVFSKTKTSEPNKILFAVISAVATVIIAQVLINIFAQDVRQADSQLGYVIGQPGKGQIAFAVFITFLVAGLAVKYFAKTGYIMPTLCVAVVVYLAMRDAASPAILENMTRNWSVAYFAKAICAILPLQMVTFGALGVFTGYQSAIKLLESQKQA